MSSAPYWGQLPAPKVTRGNSVSREQNPNMPGTKDLRIDTGVRPERLSGHSRNNRTSTQTEAATISTQSPFASPTASSFRADGLAPRPPSFPYGASKQSNEEYLDKRKRRESKIDDYYRDAAPVPPPAAPDAPRPPPPVSYKQPYTNGSPSNQGPGRVRSTRRSDGPVSPSQAPEEYYRSQARDDNISAKNPNSRRPSNGKAAVRSGEDELASRRAERANASGQRRKSSAAEGEAQKRREWAPDASPLQRLERTLDSITKEEKRARVEEAELLAREAKAGRGGERPLNQNSVRFRNRPIAKAPESGSKTEPQTLPEAGLVRNLSAKQKEQLQRSGTMEKPRPVPTDGPPMSARDFDYQPKQDVIDVVPRKEKSTNSQRRPSADKSSIPVATGAGAAVLASKVGRSPSESKKLQKEPPGDPWLHRRVEAERQFQEVKPRRPSAAELEPAPAQPTRDTAFRSHPQGTKDKDLPSLPVEAHRRSDYLDSDSDEEFEVKPVRRGGMSKIERLTGQKMPTQASKSIQPARPEVSDTDDTKYGTTTYISGGSRTSLRQGPSDAQHPRQGSANGQGVYVPSRRLDEWKTSGVALLSGSLLDLEAEEQVEIEKDKTWWEAGHSGKRRKSSARQRKAEAYDGEYDDSNGEEIPVSLRPE